MGPCVQYTCSDDILAGGGDMGCIESLALSACLLIVLTEFFECKARLGFLRLTYATLTVDIMDFRY